MSFKTGAELLAAFDLHTREQKLEQSVRALMQELELIHSIYHNQSLQDTIDNPLVFCSCADAYRMGHEALKGGN
jgi:hypothetical protein